MSFSDYLEEKLLKHTFGGGAFTAPAAIYVSLHTANPGELAAGTGELTGNAYVRVASGAFGFASASGLWTASNTGAILFPQATAAWGVVSYAGIWDALTAGNMLASSQIVDSSTGNPTTITINLGDSLRFGTGELRISLD